MILFTAISLICLLLYVYKILRYKRGWDQYPVHRTTGSPPVGISVIVAFRNEMPHLEALLSSLAGQSYPQESFEVILVNDHSVDGSDVLALELSKKHLNVRVLHNNPDEQGKKPAIMKGVHSALFDLVVTTDADCTMHENWLSVIANIFHENQADMVVGLVDMAADASFLNRFQEIEFLSLVASGAGAAAIGHPIFCNGACLAFRKDVFLSFTDPMRQKITSGEDTFFLHQLKTRRGNKIVPAKHEHAITLTRGTATFKAFLQQRRRWVSKAPYYRDADALYTAFLVFLVNAAMLYSLALLISGKNIWLFPVLYTGRFMTDAVFLNGFLRFFRKKIPWGWFMLYELLYPFYAVAIALTGIFSGFRWKGRRMGANSPIPT